MWCLGGWEDDVHRPLAALQERFRIAGPKIEPFGPPPKKDFPPKHEFKPLQDIDVPGTNADTVLWKWQFDNHYYICRLRTRYPLARHRAILLWRPWEDHARDWAKVYHTHNRGSQPANITELKRQWRKLLGLWYRDMPDNVLPDDDVRWPLELELGDASTYDPMEAWPM